MIRFTAIPRTVVIDGRCLMTFLCGPDLVVSHIWQIDGRQVQVYLPAGAEWRDAWNPKQVYEGGQTISAHVQLHQIPFYIKAGSTIDLGDLNREWQESLDAARQKPDLKTLDAGVTQWLENQTARSAQRASK